MIPATEHDTLDNLREGEVYKVNVTMPRNLLFHRKHRALLKLVFENQEQFDSFDMFYNIFKLKLGVVDQVVIDEGKVHYVIGSLSFARMDDTEFRKVYSKSVDIALEHFTKGMSGEELDNHVQRILNFT